MDNLVPRTIMSFSCRTQPPDKTLVPTYRFVGNLFQASVMYARADLRSSRRFGLVLAGTLLFWPEEDQRVAPQYEGK